MGLWPDPVEPLLMFVSHVDKIGHCCPALITLVWIVIGRSNLVLMSFMKDTHTHREPYAHTLLTILKTNDEFLQDYLGCLSPLLLFHWVTAKQSLPVSIGSIPPNVPVVRHTLETEPTLYLRHQANGCYYDHFQPVTCLSNCLVLSLFTSMFSDSAEVRHPWGTVCTFMEILKYLRCPPVRFATEGHSNTQKAV